MKKKIKVVAIVPAFNEELRIKAVLQVLRKYVDHIIVVDDGSSDKTFQVSMGRKTTVLRHIVNLGQGAAIQTGFEFAKEMNVDIVVTFDADGQFSASQINRVVTPIIKNAADVVLGSRFLGTTRNMPLRKRILLYAAIFFTKLYSGLEITDTHNGFRAFNRKAYSSISISQNRMSHASEIIQKVKQNNLRYKEVPVTVTYDNYSMKKGQKLSGSIHILFDLTLKKLFLG
jgi:polyprenyl-phospho-N-acetylgalactosaminyl synthase